MLTAKKLYSEFNKAQDKWYFHFRNTTEEDINTCRYLAETKAARALGNEYHIFYIRVLDIVHMYEKYGEDMGIILCTSNEED